MTTSGESASVEVAGAGSTTTPGAAPTAEAGGAAVERKAENGETVFEVVVELDLGQYGDGTAYGGIGSSLPGAAPPRPRETPFPPVAVGARPGDAGRGEDLFAARGCSGCHSTGTNTIVGPGLAGVADRAGAEAYIAQSIRDPASFVVPGFPNAMPPFTSLSDQELNDLIEYLKTLK